jgi:hypothetical protein
MPAGLGKPLALCRVCGFSAVGIGFKRIPFYFPFGLNSSLNFENSYLFEYMFKIHKTNFVGFVILSSIHEKHQIE